MKKTILLLLALAGGCDAFRPAAAPPPPAPVSSMDPLPVQQARAYPETVTGEFVSLADFENTPGGPSGQDQLKHFSVTGGEGIRTYVLNVTRTGAGALEATTTKNAELVFEIPDVHDFRGYTLLSLAVFCETLRDDFRITLTSDRAAWRSHRTLVRPGWNTVLIDIQRLGAVPDFDISAVRTLRLGFADVDTPLRFNLDDIMLINNTRPLTPAPAGMKLLKTGLNYALTGGKLPQPILVSQGEDGLWRLGGAVKQEIHVAAPGRKAGEGESLQAMGPVRVGVVEVLERNLCRIRLANTWYFPARPGEWANLAIRQIRWEHTFYPDGRWVSSVELNNAGGSELGPVRLTPFGPVALTGTGLVDSIPSLEQPGSVARWSYLWAPSDEVGRRMAANYLEHGQIRQTMGQPAWAPGDEDRDGFDETQGCYVLAADQAGHCRFLLTPPPGGLASPIFRIVGKWEGRVAVNSEGLLIRDIVTLDDGSILFSLPGLINRPTAVEITGQAAAGP